MPSASRRGTPAHQHELGSGVPASRSASVAVRVRDRGLDLAAVPDDPGVAEQALHVPLAEACDRVGVEAGERRDGTFSRLRRIVDPREPGLEALEAEALVDPVLVETGRPHSSSWYAMCGVVGRPAADELGHAPSVEPSEPGRSPASQRCTVVPDVEPQASTWRSQSGVARASRRLLADSDFSATNDPRLSVSSSLRDPSTAVPFADVSAIDLWRRSPHDARTSPMQRARHAFSR